MKQESLLSHNEKFSTNVYLKRLFFPQLFVLYLELERKLKPSTGTGIHYAVKRMEL